MDRGRCLRYHPLPYSPAQDMQTKFLSLTRARCSATISPLVAHGTDAKIFARTGISGLISLAMNSYRLRIIISCHRWSKTWYVVLGLLPCIVAKCGYFQAHTAVHVAKIWLKWPFPGIRVWFFIEMLSVGPENGANRG
jgi:hypothetical protein